VQAYIRHPLIWPLEILFLLAVTPHALLGVRAILLDLGPGPAAKRRLDQVLWAVGIGTVVYGVWLTWMIITYPA
jgi:succinate dehydrogenase/fumarate reductase cytochrome b subunit